MRKSKLLSIFLIFILAACGPGALPKDYQYTVAEDAQPRLEVLGPPFDIQTNNCNSTTTSTYDQQMSQTFTVQVNVQVSNALTQSLGLGGDIEGAKLQLGNQIGQTLGLTIGASVSQSATLHLQTPPGKIMTTSVQWKSSWAKGTVNILDSSGKAMGSAPFSVLNSVVLDQLGNHYEVCPTPRAPTQAPAVNPPSGERTKIRWLIGLGTGNDPEQVNAEKAVVDDFNASQNEIQLVVEFVPTNSAQYTLASEFAAGNGPDIVGPVGWSGSFLFHDQWLDLSPLISSTGYDTSRFNSSLLRLYRTDLGQESLPFAIYPSALFYNKSLFDRAHLNYPPTHYSDSYQMPDGSTVEWTWDSLAKLARLLTVDSSGQNATMPDFDKNNIVQYGYSWNYETAASYVGSYFASGAYLAPDGSAQLPDGWKAAWAWTYDGTWGSQPFIPNGNVSASPIFNNGNVFDSGKVAMMAQPVWDTCCLNDVKTWDVAAIPSYNGKPGGRIDADTFRIWKGSQHPEEAFKVLSYLTGAGVDRLIIGSGNQPPAYDAFPALSSEQGAWVESIKARFPFVKNWDVFLEGLNYPDVPNAEAYMPNYTEAWNRNRAFYSRLASTDGLNLADEEQTFLNDLNDLFRAAHK